MRKYILFIGLFLNVLLANAQIAFQIVTVDTALTNAAAVVELDNGDFIIGGDYNHWLEDTLGDSDAFLMRMDNEGNIKWFKTYGNESLNEDVRSIIKTNDNGFIFCGTIYDNQYLIYLIKVDSIGNKQWVRAYGNTLGGKIFEAKDGGYYIMGESHESNGDFLLMHLNDQGNIRWAKSYGGFGEEIFGEGVVTDDKGFILVGASSDSFLPSSWDSKTYILQTDSNGVLQWGKLYKYKNHYSSWGDGVLQLNDKSFIVSITPQDLGGFYFQSLLRINNQGDLVWVKEYTTINGYNFTSVTDKIIEDAFGNIISLGVNFISNLDFTPLILKTNLNGEIIWQKQVDHFDPEISLQVYNNITTLDKGFLFVGAASSSLERANIYIAKTDSLLYTSCNTEKTIETTAIDSPVDVYPADSSRDVKIDVFTFPITVKDVMPLFKTICSNVGVNEKVIINNEKLRILPNPFTTTATIEIATEKAINNWQFEVYNVLGEKVKTINNINNNRVTLDRKGLGNGLYLYLLKRNDEILSNGKFVVE